MIVDKCGKLIIEYKDINNKLINDYDKVPNNAIIAFIHEIFYNEELNNSYKVIIGKPVCMDEDILLLEDEKYKLGNNPTMAVGEFKGIKYFVFINNGDIVVPNIETFNNTIEQVSSQFLEKLDNEDIKRFTLKNIG